jgi:hypothetical protein
MTVEFKQSISDILDQVFDKLSAKDIYTDGSHRFNESGDRMRGGCPWHQSKSNTSFVVTKSTKQWYCAGCHIGGGPLQYLHRLNGGDGSPQGQEFIDLVKQLCEKTGVEFPEGAPREDDERMLFLQERSALLENVIEFCQGRLSEAHYKYLQERGFTREHVAELEIGFYDIQKLRAHLKGYPKHLLDGTGVLWEKLDGYLVFPWRDDKRRALTLYFKWTSKTPPDGRPKTIALMNPKMNGVDVLSSKYVPYCFDRAKEQKNLVLVESVTDAALAQVRGDKRVFACVAAQLSEGQVKTLKRHGVKSVTICLDPDSAGDRGIESCCRQLSEAGIKALVAPRLPDGQDPDEFIQQHGVDAWREHIAKAVQDSRESIEDDCDFEIKTWPTLPPAVLTGIAGEVVELATRKSEADPAAVLATFICRAAAEFGPKPYIMVGDSRHSARVNAVIVGNSAKARKGTSGKPIIRIFRFDSQDEAADSPLLYVPARETPGPLSSGEGLIYAVRDEVKAWQVNKKTGEGKWIVSDPGVTDKRLFVLDEELAAALKCTKREGNTLSVVIRSAFDDGNFSPLTKNNRIEAHGAHIVIVSHITLSELHYLLDETEALNGFANRFLWICSRRQKLVELPEPMPEFEVRRIQRELLKIMAAVRSFGRLDMSKAARDYGVSIYENLSSEQPGLVGCVVNRGEALVLRLALIYALLSASDTIEVEHLESALAFWSYAKQSSEYIFNGRQSNPVAQKILDAVERGPMSFTDVYGLLSNHATKTQIQIAVQEMASSGKVEVFDEKTSGRPKKIMRLAKEAKKGCRTDSNEELNSLSSHNSQAQKENECSDSPKCEEWEEFTI